MIQGDFVKLKIPDSEKNEAWFKYQADRIVPSPVTARIEDLEEMDRIYKFMHNDFSGYEEELKSYCGILGEYGSLEEEFNAYNPLPNKIDILKGELLARESTQRLMLMTAKAVRRKDVEFQQKVKSAVDQELARVVEMVQQEMSEMNEEQQAGYIEQLRKDSPLSKLDRRKFMSQGEMIFNKLLQYTDVTQDIRTKKVGTLEDLSYVARFFLYTGWRNGKPVIEVLNPKNTGFNKNPNEPFIQKSDYVWYKDSLTIADALDEYGNKMKKDDLIKIMSYAQRGNSITRDHVERPVFDHTRYYSLLEQFGFSRDQNDIREGLHQGNQIANTTWHQLLWRTHLEFKAYSEIIFLTHTDSYGERITVQLKSKADIIPSSATKVKFVNAYMDESEKYVWSEGEQEYEAEIIWIPRRYELTRLGSDLYFDMREVPLQPDYGTDVFNRFELSYKGGIFFNRNSKAISPVQRTLPYVFQYMAARRLQDREMAKFIGQETVIDVDQIPQGLAADHNGNAEMGTDPILEQNIVARLTGQRITSSSQNYRGLPPPSTRGAGVQHSIIDGSAILMNLENFCNMLDQRVGLRMGISPSREAQSNPNATATDNRQDLIQSNAATGSLFYFLDLVWNTALNEHVRNISTQIRRAFADEPGLSSYDLEAVLPDGSREYFQVLPDHLDQLEDIGLFQIVSGKEERYFRTMMDNVFSFAQNGGDGAEIVSGVLKALVTTNSVEEAHEIITQASREMQERLAAESQQQQANIAEAKKAQQELMEYQASLALQSKLQEIEFKAAKEAQGRKDNLEIQTQMLAQQYDINENKVNDAIEVKKMELEHETKENEKDRALERDLAAANRRSKAQ